MHNSISAAALVKHYASRFHTNLNAITDKPVEGRISREVFAELVFRAWSDVSGFGNIIAKLESEPWNIAYGTNGSCEEWAEPVLEKYSIEVDINRLLDLLGDKYTFPVVEYWPNQTYRALAKDMPKEIAVNGEAIDFEYGLFEGKHRPLIGIEYLPDDVLTAVKQAFQYVEIPSDQRPSGTTPRTGLNVFWYEKFFDLDIELSDRSFMAQCVATIEGHDLIEDAWESGTDHPCHRDDYREGFHHRGSFHADLRDPERIVVAQLSVQATADQVCELLAPKLIEINCITGADVEAAQCHDDLRALFDTVDSRFIYQELRSISDYYMFHRWVVFDTSSSKEAAMQRVAEYHGIPSGRDMESYGIEFADVRSVRLADKRGVPYPW